MCRALSRYFIVSGKGQFIVWEEGGEALSGRTSNEHAWFFFSLSLFSFCALSQLPSNTFAFNYQARGQN